MRYQLLRILRSPGSAHSIALGLAIGVFVGLLPIVPLQTAAVLVLAWFLRCSKMAAMAGTWVANPIYLPALYYLMYLVGEMVFPSHGTAFAAGGLFGGLESGEVFGVGLGDFQRMLAGGVILGLPSAAAVYFAAYFGLRRHARLRALRLSQVA
jgi:uncharacterized protein (DUF2062 family)